jgi:hypothetical protein
VFADPALLRVGAFELRWSGALLALGLALGYLAVRAAAARQGVSPRALHDAALWSLPEALLAARVAHVVAHPETYLAAPARIVQVWDGGFSFGAGLLVGLWALARYARRHGLPGGRLLDATVPGLLIAQGLSGVGRAADAVATSLAPLPLWDEPPRTPAGPAAPAPLASAAGDSFVLAPLGIALWALALLLSYALMARRRPPGLLFRAYLLLQALGQIAIRLATGGGAPDTLGIAAWAAVAVAAALSTLYHLRSVKC